MARSVSKSESSLSLDEKTSSFQETILNKFKFVRTLKKYVLSKLRTGKYDFGNDFQKNISIISFDQRSFTDIEKDFDLEETKPAVEVDPQILETLKKVLSKSYNSRNVPNAELLELVEKTFARQLDIFEALIQPMGSKNRDRMSNLEKQLKSNSGSADNFVNDIVENLVAELSKTLPSSEKKSREPSVERKPPTEDENLGDNRRVRSMEVSCECQIPRSSGAAVPNKSGES